MESTSLPSVHEPFPVDEHDKPYDVSEWLASQIHRTQQQDTASSINARKHKQFKQICAVVKKELEKVINTDENQDKNNEWLERQHRAIIGDPVAIGYFIAEIERVLRDHNITSNDYPAFFNKLSEAIFHEIWGVSVLAKWEQYPESEACAIIGQELWIDIDGKFVKQEEEFESIERVEKIKRSFMMRREDSIINRENPEAEIEREDGSRITMIQPPRARDNYIMLRRFVVDKFTLEDQAARGTIPYEDIPIYRALARVMANMIIAGRVRSAKSTFMKTLIGERKKDYVIACLEKHFELALKKHFPDRLIFEVQSKEGDLHRAIPRLLRMEHDYIVIGEIRSLEMEAYLLACERGERGALSTYHLTDVEYVVEQLARHVLDEFPTRKFEVEVERVAKNLDIIITMASDRDRRRKRVIGVTEVVYDYQSRKHFTNDLIRYSPLTGQYYYSSNLSKSLLYRFAEEDLGETKILLQTLRERERVSPMSAYRADFIDDLLSSDPLTGEEA
jgi:pilus assembly protein CpaF